MDRGCRPVDIKRNTIFKVVLTSDSTSLSLNFAFILCGTAGGVKESTRVIFILGLSLIVWIPRSINSLKVANKENAT